MATIYEVAARAGVSPATVSRVINGVGVSAANELKVREAAKRLNFVPNRAARTLRTRSSEVIALIIPDIENPFFTSLARGVEDRAQQAGLSVLLCNSDDRAEKEQRYLQIAVSEHIAGIIVAPAGRHSALDEATDRGIPIVAVDRSAPAHDIDAVLADNRSGARTATASLYDQGHRLVACITGPRDVETATERAAGWREVFRQHHPGLPTRRYLRHSDYRVAGGAAAVRSLMALDDPPDAVFVANNLMAVGVLGYLAATAGATGEGPPGALVATAVSVLGDLPFASLRSRGLTVVDLPAHGMGAAAAELLLARIKGDGAPPRVVVVP